MPSTRSRNSVTTYEALPPPKHQKQFPARRRSIRRGPAETPVPKLNKDQSTLTQHHSFDAPTSSRSRVKVELSDSEFEEEDRPKKKLKTSGSKPTSRGKSKSKFGEKEAGQTTYTQFHRDWSAKKEGEYGLDEDGFQIWEDSGSEAERVMKELETRQQERRSKMPWLEKDEENDLKREKSLEIPETSQNDPPGSSCNTQEDVGRKSTDFQTPRRVRFTEVPSSQTPPSTVCSWRTTRQVEEIRRSPLKERSGNLQHSTKSSPSARDESNPELPGTAHLATQKVPLNDVVDGEPRERGLSPPKGTEATAKVHPLKTRAPYLKRATTIGDSQSEDATVSSVSSAETGARPARSLKRVATIQDSQVDDEDAMSEHFRIVDDEVDEAGEAEIVEESQFQYPDTQATFDPAMSALDRDASRFAWTQTQRQLSDIGEDDADDETDDDDLDRGCVGNKTERTIMIPSDPPVGDLEEPASTTIEQIAETQQRRPPTNTTTVSRNLRPASRDDSAYESGDHAHQEEIQVLSSSPPPRPSQVSTYVPTQASVRDALQDSRTSQQMKAANESFAIPASPRQSVIQPPDIFSSSPVPLPPWSSSEKHGAWNHGEGSASDRLGGLMDFSLPPPPMLSSSSGKGTPVSSGR